MWIRRGDIPSYFNETFMTSFREWSMFKTFGLSHGVPANERNLYLQVLKIFEEEVSALQAEKIRKKWTKS